MKFFNKKTTRSVLKTVRVDQMKWIHLSALRIHVTQLWFNQQYLFHSLPPVVPLCFGHCIIDSNVLYLVVWHCSSLVLLAEPPLQHKLRLMYMIILTIRLGSTGTTLFVVERRIISKTSVDAYTLLLCISVPVLSSPSCLLHVEEAATLFTASTVSKQVRYDLLYPRR
jgi:hypothetical protein